jgi:hypothetical protein
MRAILACSLMAVSCASPGPKHPTATEGLPAPHAEAPQQVLVTQRGAKTLVTSDGPARITVDDERVVEVWSTPESASIIGKTQGRTMLHVARPGMPKLDVVVDVVAPRPNERALTIGERVLFAATNIAEWSESGPGIVEVSSSGGAVAVTGRKPGTNVVVFVSADGAQRSVEFTVVGGERQVPAAGKPNPNAVVFAVGDWTMIPSGRDVRFYDVRPSGIVEVVVSPDHLGLDVRALKPGTAEVVLVRDDGSESFAFIVIEGETKP